jgi:hypothetical protein
LPAVRRPDGSIGEELQHLVGLGAERAFLGGDAPRPNQAFHRLARLPAGHHHQVLAHRSGRELMRDLEGAQQALGEQFMRRQAGDVLAIHDDPAGGRRQRPAITLNSVVLPAPLGPISPVIEPVSIVRLAPSTA